MRGGYGYRGPPKKVYKCIDEKKRGGKGGKGGKRGGGGKGRRGDDDKD